MLSNKQKEDIQIRIELEGHRGRAQECYRRADYYLTDYISPKRLEEEYGDEKLVELHHKLLQARAELFNYIGLK